jgi:hypothetical protein
VAFAGRGRRNQRSGKDMGRPTSTNDPTMAANPSSTGAPGSEVAQSEGGPSLHSAARSEARAWTMSRLKLLYDDVAREPLPTAITALVQRAARN